ncbi:hypothetical protein STEG23_016258, partial [Scotinomys teguina]
MTVTYSRIQLCVASSNLILPLNLPGNHEHWQYPIMLEVNGPLLANNFKRDIYLKYRDEKAKTSAQSSDPKAETLTLEFSGFISLRRWGQVFHRYQQSMAYQVTVGLSTSSGIKAGQ